VFVRAARPRSGVCGLAIVGIGHRGRCAQRVRALSRGECSVRASSLGVLRASCYGASMPGSPASAPKLLPGDAAPDHTAPSARVSAHLALVIVQTCFGLSPIFVKRACVTGAFTPFAVGVWRMFFAAGALLCGAWLCFPRRLRPERADVPRLVACSLLGVVVNMTLYLEGLQRSTAVNAGLVMCLIPVFTFGVAALAGQERFGIVRAAGIAVALAGASLLFWAEQPELVRAHGFGNLLMALNTLSYACYLVAVRPLTRKYPPLVVVAWVFGASLLFVPVLCARALWGSALPLDAAFGEFVAPARADSHAWWSLAFVLVFPTALAYFLNSFALAHVRATTTAVYVYLQPLITAVAGVLVLHEEVTRTMFVAAALVFAGIWLVVRPPKFASRDAAEPART